MRLFSLRGAVRPAIVLAAERLRGPAGPGRTRAARPHAGTLVDATPLMARPRWAHRVKLSGVRKRLPPDSPRWCGCRPLLRGASSHRRARRFRQIDADQVLLGLVRPRCGNDHVLGAVVGAASAYRRRIGYMPQGAPFPGTSLAAKSCADQSLRPAMPSTTPGPPFQLGEASTSRCDFSREAHARSSMRRSPSGSAGAPDSGRAHRGLDPCRTACSRKRCRKRRTPGRRCCSRPIS